MAGDVRVKTRNGLREEKRENKIKAREAFSMFISVNNLVQSSIILSNCHLNKVNLYVTVSSQGPKLHIIYLKHSLY